MKLLGTTILNIDTQATILSRCQDVPFSTANLINGLSQATKPVLKEIDAVSKLLQDRLSEIQQQSDNKDALAQFSIDVKQANEKEFEIEFTPVDVSLFKDLDIKGFRDVKQQNGELVKFDYRDAYFFLVEQGLIK